MDYYARKKHAEKLFGVYVLDIQKTDLGVYKFETEKYKNLQIIFEKDMTFRMSMSVPFAFDSCGTWEAESFGVEDWGKVYFKRKNYIIDAPLSGCCSADSTMYLNSVTPVEGKQPVSAIYFKKLNPKLGDFEW